MRALSDIVRHTLQKNETFQYDLHVSIINYSIYFCKLSEFLRPGEGVRSFPVLKSAC
jgi:hypothetical protein